MRSPIDVAVAVVLAEHPGMKFESLAQTLGISASKAFDSVKRLTAVGVALPDGRRINRLALFEFLEHGIQYVFPATPGVFRQGIPTGRSGPVLADALDAGDEPLVWPCAGGPVRGRAIVPLVPKASDLPQRSPNTYVALSLVDAVRTGGARERHLALQALRQRFGAPTAAVHV